MVTVIVKSLLLDQFIVKIAQKVLEYSLGKIYG